MDKHIKDSIKGVQRISFIVHYSLRDKRRDGQAGLNAVLKETIGHPLLSFSPLETMGKD